jgi:cytochrome oxidase Cu insertion factor (SCO1/SenC/PrrC family)
MAQPRTYLAALGLVATCAAVTASSSRAVLRRPPPLPEHGTVPAFSLTDHHGQPLTRERLDGSVWVADFIFTRCAGQCPLLTERMAQLQRQLGGERDLRLVSFSVDPGHDTPEVLAAHARRTGAGPGWWWVTGAPEAIRALIQEGFRLGIREEGTEEEPITHSVRLVLVDRQGRIRGYYDALEAEAVARLADDARQLLREPRGE